MPKKNKSKVYSTRLSAENEEFVLLKAIREERTVSQTIDRLLTKIREIMES